MPSAYKYRQPNITISNEQMQAYGAIGGTLSGYGYAGTTPITIGGGNAQILHVSTSANYDQWDAGSFYGSGNVSYNVEMPQPIKFEARVRVAPIPGLFATCSDLPAMLKAIREQAAEIISSRLPPVRVATLRPVGAAMLHGDENQVIEAATHITEHRPRITANDIMLESERIENGYHELTFQYVFTGSVSIDMSVSDDFVRKVAADMNMEKMRKIMRNRHAISHKSKEDRRVMPMTALQANEVKARETLREMITESEWRRYLTNGFIMVRAPSGLDYQIFGRGDRLKVFKANELVESVCIHTSHECPPTDHVINMKVLLEIDEEAVRKGGNIRKLEAPRNERRLGEMILGHLQQHADNGVIDQASVDAARARGKRAAKLEELRSSSESLVSIYKKLRTA